MSVVAFVASGLCISKRRSIALRRRYEYKTRMTLPGRTSVYPDEDLVVISIDNKLLSGAYKSERDVGVKTVVDGIAEVIDAGYRVCVIHGEAVKDEERDQNRVMIDRALEDRLDPMKQVVTLLIRSIVRQNDPELTLPTKVIGRDYHKNEAERMMARGGTMRMDVNDMYRRVVSWLEPVDILEAEPIRILLNGKNMTVICTNGGGYPFLVEDDNHYVDLNDGLDDHHVDENTTARLLASLIGAKYLLFLTTIDGLYDEDQYPLQDICSDVLNGQLADGSTSFHNNDTDLKLKLIAAGQFASFVLGGIAAIGKPTDAVEILQGKRGTSIQATPSKSRYVY